jgi:hypothetical protein
MEFTRQTAESLSLGRVDPDASDALVDVYREAAAVFESNPEQSARAGERIVSSFHASPESAPVWVFAQAFTLFTQGVAAGRGHEQVHREDVETARGMICAFPSCPFERVTAALEVLEATSVHFS